MALTLHKGTTSRLGLIGLKDADATAVTNATVQAWLFDKSGYEIGDSTFPISLTHDASGNYYGDIDAAVDVQAKKFYKVRIVATAASLRAQWFESVICEHANNV